MFDQRDAVTAPELRRRGSLKWSRFGGDTIGAFVAEMDFGTAPAVERALRAAVEAGTFGYLPPALADGVARACAGWQQERYGWVVQPGQVQPVSDVLTALELVMRHFTRPNSPIILPTPAYMPFLTVPPLHGREIIQVPMLRSGNGHRRPEPHQPERVEPERAKPEPAQPEPAQPGRYELDLAGIDAAYRRGGELLILCNPANPVGRVFTAAELAAVTEVVDRHGGRVFADEVHAPLVFPGHRHLPYAGTSDTAAGHTITATSASKAWNLPGLKCAQVILTAADLDLWQQVGRQASAMASTLGTVANTAAYESGGGWLDELLGYLDRNRHALGELLAERLPEVGYLAQEGTYLAWLDFRRLRPATDAGQGTGQGAGQGTGRDTGRLDEFLRERAGVAVVDGADCGDSGRGYIRLNTATPLPILQQAVARMARACADGRKPVR